MRHGLPFDLFMFVIWQSCFLSICYSLLYMCPDLCFMILTDSIMLPPFVYSLIHYSDTQHPFILLWALLNFPFGDLLQCSHLCPLCHNWEDTDWKPFALNTAEESLLMCYPDFWKHSLLLFYYSYANWLYLITVFWFYIFFLYPAICEVFDKYTVQSCLSCFKFLPLLCRIHEWRLWRRGIWGVPAYLPLPQSE